jgi:hypothetical protein
LRDFQIIFLELALLPGQFFEAEKDGKLC